MEAIGAASAILAIASAGVQCSVKLVTFAGQVKTAPEQINMVAEDVSLNASILQQLGELAKENVGIEPSASDDKDDNGNNTNVKSVSITTSKQSIFNTAGLETVTHIAKKCKEIFESLDESLRTASKQLHAKPRILGKVKLSRAERFKWPFLLPEIDTMRNELGNVKGNLMLILQIAMLAYSRRMVGGYGESQRTTAIVTYSREDQELLVRSIVAAQKVQETSKASNVGSFKKERPMFSQLSPSNQASDVDSGLTGTPVSDRQETDPNPENNIHDESSSVKLISPRASITNQQIHITYDTRIIKLPNSTVESQLQEWMAALDTTLLDQLAALNSNELEALDAASDDSDRPNLQEERLEWIRFSGYRTLIQGIEHIKARTLTVIMSGVPQPTRRPENKEKKEETRITWTRVHRDYILPKTLEAFGLPWDWDEDDTNFLIIKKWIADDIQELLFAHTRRLQQDPVEIAVQASSTYRQKDKMFLVRKRSPSRRVRLFDPEEQFETILDRKKANRGNEEKNKAMDEMKEKDQHEHETDDGEYDGASESDDAEGIVDALLARYTV
ncbi:Glucose-methanol-choline oxidoreductase N-terminal [Penicillium robsamsonii]|uniref:Glucose-methanol-choline oxidoreductase N-terminal n=1 Tax=Penicillium robsamsonii TaxID=1792511 RepID=UPI0025488A01|nr:Glucose-methanol-choline oxidoreductase N-terminal [Penicillium robsamsonii]KAJ5817461.1 Glucose-methanol-choline oxidoreductase N-terminal [Penicillium robsamsonii]